jgi:hypothetical protein
MWPGASPGASPLPMHYVTKCHIGGCAIEDWVTPFQAGKFADFAPLAITQSTHVVTLIGTFIVLQANTQ